MKSTLNHRGQRPAGLAPEVRLTASHGRPLGRGGSGCGSAGEDTAQFLQLAAPGAGLGLTAPNVVRRADALPLSLGAIAGTSGTLVAWRKLARATGPKLESALPGVGVRAPLVDLREQEIEDGRDASGERGAPHRGRAHRAHRVPRAHSVTYR